MRASSTSFDEAHCKPDDKDQQTWLSSVFHTSPVRHSSLKRQLGSRPAVRQRKQERLRRYWRRSYCGQRQAPWLALTRSRSTRWRARFLLAAALERQEVFVEFFFG